MSRRWPSVREAVSAAVSLRRLRGATLPGQAGQPLHNAARPGDRNLITRSRAAAAAADDSGFLSSAAAAACACELQVGSGQVGRPARARPAAASAPVPLSWLEQHAGRYGKEKASP